MKRLLFIAVLVFVCIHNVMSHNIQGIVFDENNKPMVGATVYLDGTSIGTLTTVNGTYNIEVKDVINTSLIISCLGYKPVVIQKPFENNNSNIHLTPKVTVINEVEVKGDRFTRKSKLKLFREQFLGTTKAGRQCRIMNEDDIQFRYDLTTNTLYAWANNPLVIKNSYTGYEVTFSITEFYAKFFQRSIFSADVSEMLYLGMSYFKDLSEGKASFSRKRERVYQGSSTHFFLSLVNSKLNENRFIFFNGSVPADPKKYFVITDTTDLKKVVVKLNYEMPDTNLMKGITFSQHRPDSTVFNNKVTRFAKRDSTINNRASEVPANKESNGFKFPDIKFRSTFNILYRRNRQSQVVFNINTFYVDKYGNYTDIDKIIFGGDLGESRLGNLLPLDYSKTNK